MANNSTVSRDLLIAVSVAPATCALLIIIGVIIYIILRKTKKSSSVAADSSSSPIHEHSKDLKLTRTIVPLNGSIKNVPMSPRRAQSVEYTFFNESGDVDEIQFYTDEQEAHFNDTDDEHDPVSDTPSEDYEVPSVNGHTNVALSEDYEVPSVNGHTNVAFSAENDGADYEQSRNTESNEEAHLPYIENIYIRPDNDHTVYILPDSSPPAPGNNEDEYVLPDPPRKTPVADGDEEEPDYAQPDLPRGIVTKKAVNGDKDDYVKPDPPKDESDYVQPDPPRHPPRDEASSDSENQQPEYANLKTRKL